MNSKLALSMSVASAALLAAVSPAQAGAYVSLFGGWNSTQDVKGRSGNGLITSQLVTTVIHTTTGLSTHAHTFTFNFSGAGTFNNSGAKAEDGFVLGAAVGGDLSHWLSGLRGEFEVSLRRNNLGAASALAQASDTDTDTDTFSDGTISHSCALTPLAPLTVVSGAPNCVADINGTSATRTFQATLATSAGAASSSGNVRTFALMANAWYDFDFGSSFKPYVGVGVGYATNEIQHGLVFNGSKGGFAWQAGGGVNYPITDKTSIGVGYRYMDAGDVTLTRFNTVFGQLKDTYDVQHHSVLVNVNFSLGK